MKNNIINKIISLILIIGVIGISIYCIITNINNIPNIPTFLIINISVVFAAIFGFIFIICDTRKQLNERWLKIYITLEALIHLISVLRTSITGSSVITPVFHTLIFGLICILLYDKYLNKKQSYLLCFTIFVLDITVLIISNVNNFALPRFINTSSATIIDIILILLLGNKIYIKNK